ncbi:flagellar biosynthesis anti-sigma factor FlgM [Sphingosinicella humi]|uniref:Negative regulator of flagellin synthesis n=1 Tax=Allosphingosinicella humi TaxID=2068657 RepID=A0A2U2J112_9SPHN|nr:flagellar biosynthesis anti-sigma factor FlgM [Sphingosinicella humi]PWG02023.1 flagellar biosynthesis anti-sigma factor FlgM [Sphingosinicella humi]
MIDGIGKTGATGRIDVARATLERSQAAAKAGDALSRDAVSAPATPAAEMAASGAPVDSEKVAAIRAAIAEGRYPVDPDKIAEKMLELDLPPRSGA